MKKLKLSKQLTKKEKEQYIAICEKIWGCIPVDVEWAMETNIYKQNQKLNNLCKPNEKP